MKIGYRFATFEANRSGVNRTIYDTVGQILKLDTQNDYYCLEENYLQFDNIKRLTPDFVFDVQMNNAVDYTYMLGGKLELVHSHFSGINNLKIKCPKIITMYDLVAVKFPEWLPQMVKRFQTEFKYSAQKADKIIAISECTKNDIVYYYDIPPERIDVVYLGLSSVLNFDNCADLTTEKYGLQDGYILSVCTLEPRKNLRGLVEGFIRYKQENENSAIKLVLAGKAGWDNTFRNYLRDQGKYAEDIIVTGYVSDKELSSLYKNSIAFAYVSFYEGFGLPILEGMSAGKAVLCSNTSSMPEVGGDAVCYCNPYSIESITSGIKRLVDDESYRHELENKAIVRSKIFSYEKTARETLKIYKTFE